MFGFGGAGPLELYYFVDTFKLGHSEVELKLTIVFDYVGRTPKLKSKLKLNFKLKLKLNVNTE